MQSKKTDTTKSDYLTDKVNGLVSNIGSQYGDLLLDELFRRLDNTITDFDDEINDLFSSLKEHEQKKQSVIGLMKKGKTVTKDAKSKQLISDWEIKIAELEGDNN